MVIDRRKRLLTECRLIDLTHLWAGPLSTCILCRLGASVIKVEGPRRPDPLRLAGRLGGDGVPSFDALNAGKRFLALELGRERGLAVLERLLRSADGVVDNFSPRAWRNWGVDPTTWAHELGVAWVSMPAFSAAGPFRDRGARGSGLEGTSGYAWRSGSRAEPVLATPTHVDPLSGTHAAFALLCALHRGGSTHVELSQNGLAHSIAAVASAASPPAWHSMSSLSAPGEMVAPSRAPMGAHSLDVLRELGYCERECEALVGDGTVLQASADGGRGEPAHAAVP